MRKLTVGILGLGCLALLVATIAVSTPASLNAKKALFQPDYAGCLASQAVPAPCKGDRKVEICHFNEGADFGKLHCQEPGTGTGGYESHIGPLGHGSKDFCVTSAEDEEACVKGTTPPGPK